MIANPNAKDVVNEAAVVKKMFAMLRKDVVSFVVNGVNSSLHHSCGAAHSNADELQVMEFSKLKDIVLHYSYHCLLHCLEGKAFGQ